MLSGEGRRALNQKPLRAPSIVLFDLDGTVVRHVDPRVIQMLEALDDVAHHACKLLSMLPGRRRRVPSRPPRLLVHRAIHKIRSKQVEEIVEPTPGIFELLEVLRASSVRTGLVSNCLGRGYGRDIIAAFGLGTCFETTVFREDVQRGKPWPDCLLTALDRLPGSVRSSDVVWYVGDQRKDVMAALAAQSRLPCEIVPVAFGLRAAAYALERGMDTDHVVFSMPALTERFVRMREQELEGPLPDLPASSRG